MWGLVVQWLVQRFRSERLRIRSRRSATFTPSALEGRQSLPVWPPTLNKRPLPFTFLLATRLDEKKTPQSRRAIELRVLPIISWTLQLYRTASFALVATLCMGLVRPCLEYGGVVWDSCLQRDAFALELHSYLSRGQSLIWRTMSNSVVLKTIGWPTLAWRRLRRNLFCLWQWVQGRGPPALRETLPMSISSRTEYIFRNTASLTVPKCSKSCRFATFLLATILLWNSLPSFILSSSSPGSFFAFSWFSLWVWLLFLWSALAIFSCQLKERF